MFDYLKNIAKKIYFWQKKSVLSKKKNVRFGINTHFNRSTYFEGNNYLSTNAELIDSHIGFASYLGKNTRISNTKIGKYTSIGPEVLCVFGNHPTHIFVSSHPAFFSIRKQSGFSFVEKQLYEEFSSPIKGSEPYTISIGNDVWIGSRVTILDGVEIGDGAIIASGALVNKSVAPYSIVGGVPAKEIKKRFSEEEIEFLLEFKWWDKSFDWIKKNSTAFTNIEEFKHLRPQT